MFRNRYFYNKSMRNYVVLMGTLFNDLGIVRKAGDAVMKVPLHYQNKEKFVSYLTNRNSVGSDPSNVETEIILPAMSFYMRGVRYDPTRKVNKINYGVNVEVRDDGTRVHRKQLAPVPYIFEFDVSIYTRYEDDVLQIVEQILPYFQPHFTAKIKENTLSGVIDRDIWINLADVRPEEEMIGLMVDGRRVIQWELRFELYGYLYPEIQDAHVIKRTVVDFVGDEVELIDPDNSFLRVEHEVVPFTADKDEPHKIVETRTYPYEQ